MKFKWHFLIGFVVSYILVYFFNFSLISGFVIFVSSWLIDIDHYFWWIFTTKNKNPISALSWYNSNANKWGEMSPEEKDKFKIGVFVFHSICFWIFLGFLSFLSPIFLWILIGVATHMFADLLDMAYYNEPLYGKIFLIAVLVRNKNKKAFVKL